MVAGEDDEGGFGSVAVVAFAVFGEIHEDGVVEHGSFALGGGFEFFDDGGDLFHMTEADFFADLVGGDAAVAAVVAEFVDGNVIAFISRHAFDGGGKFVDGVGDDVGEAGDEGGDEDVGHGLLLLGGAGIESAFGVDRGELGEVFGDGAGHFFELLVAGADGLDGVDVVAEFEFFVALEDVGFEGFLTFEELEHGVVGVDGIWVVDGFKEFVVSSLRVGVAVVALVGGGGGVAGDDASTKGTIVSGEGEFDMAEGGRGKLGEFEVDGGALDSAEGIAARFVGTHDGGVGPVAVFAHLAGEALEDGEVGFVARKRLHPGGEFVAVEVDLECLSFGVEGFLLGREGGEGDFIGTDAVGLADEDEALRWRTGQGCSEGWGEDEGAGSEGGVSEEVSSSGHERLLGLAVEEGIGGEEGEDDGVEAAATFNVSGVGVDEGFGIGEEFITAHEVAKGVADDGLADAGGLAEAVGEVEGVCDFAIESGVVGSFEKALGIDGESFVGVAEIDVIGCFVGAFFEEVVGVFERLLGAEAAEVIEHFEGVAERVHAFVAAPAVFLFGNAGEAITEGHVVVFWNDSFHGDGDFGDGAGEEFFADPLAADDGVGLGVLGVGDEPGGVGEHAFAVLDFGRLDSGVVPLIQHDVVELGDLGAAELEAGAGVGVVFSVGGKGDEGGGCGFAFVEAEGEAGEGCFEFADGIAAALLFGAEFVDVDAAHLDFGEEGFVFDEVFDLEVLPVEVFEVIVDAANALRGGGHGLVIPGVVDVEFIGGEEFLDDVGILLQEVLDKAVGFGDEAAFCAIVVAAEAFAVFEDGEHVLVAEELAEEAEGADGEVSDAGGVLEALHAFIDEVELVAFFEEADDFALVVRSGGEFAIGGSGGEFGIG
ncbi:MAG: hypothetical protein ACI8UZ_000548 [Akkermansiaceae bacterium]